VVPDVIWALCNVVDLWRKVLLMLVERSRLIAKYISTITQLKFNPGVERVRLGQLVDIVNTFLVPKAWIGIDDEGLLHVTYMTTERHEPNGKMWKPGPASLMMSADYAWEYIPLPEVPHR